MELLGPESEGAELPQEEISPDRARRLDALYDRIERGQVDDEQLKAAYRSNLDTVGATM